MLNIAVIGAGLAGVSFARELADRAKVTVFEKSRGAGGRMATRYAGPFEFDHGAQYFTVRSEAFRAALDPFLASGLVQAWAGRVVRLKPGTAPEDAPADADRYVAVPRMNALVKAMADGLDLRPGVQVAKLDRCADGWHLLDAEGTAFGPFDWVVSSAPSVQAAALAPPGFSGAEALRSVRMRGNFTLMLGFEETLEPGWEGAFVDDNPLGWIAVNSAKPGRPGATSLVVQSANDWAEAHLEDDPERVKAAMIREVKVLTGIDAGRAVHSALHRWRYADVPTPAGAPFLMDEVLRFAACGDWCLKGRVEAAFTSGTGLAGALKSAPRGGSVRSNR